MESAVSAPRFSCASTTRRFLFFSASCPPVPMTSSIRPVIAERPDEICLKLGRRISQETDTGDLHRRLLCARRERPRCLPHASTEQTLPRPPSLEVGGLAKDKCSRGGTRLNITVVRKIWANQEGRTDVTAGQAGKSFMPPQGSRPTIGTSRGLQQPDAGELG